MNGASSSARRPERSELAQHEREAALPLARPGAEPGERFTDSTSRAPAADRTPDLVARHVLAGAEDRLTHAAASPARRPASAARGRAGRAGHLARGEEPGHARLPAAARARARRRPSSASQRVGSAERAAELHRRRGRRAERDGVAPETPPRAGRARARGRAPRRPPRPRTGTRATSTPAAASAAASRSASSSPPTTASRAPGRTPCSARSDRDPAPGEDARAVAARDRERLRVPARCEHDGAGADEPDAPGRPSSSARAARRRRARARRRTVPIATSPPAARPRARPHAAQARSGSPGAPRRARSRPPAAGASVREEDAPPGLRERLGRREAGGARPDDERVDRSSAGAAPEAPAVARTGSRPTPESRRATATAARFARTLHVASRWWSRPRGVARSITPRRSCRASGKAFWVSTSSPSRHGVRQARRLGRPSTRTRHPPHEPARQKGPRGRWYLAERERSARPAARSADATLAARRAAIGAPSNRIVASVGKPARRGMRHQPSEQAAQRPGRAGVRARRRDALRRPRL